MPRTVQSFSFAHAHRGTGLAAALVALTFIALTALAPTAEASCKDASTTGGLGVANTKCVPVKKARLVNGRAIAPANAPAVVKRVIAAANKIRLKPYIYGGGHRRLKDRGYDCSGSVSFALRGGNLLKGSMPSSGFYNWELAGAGKWITIYTKASHMYMVVAGLSFDTSNMRSNGGNRWSTVIRPPKGFKVRHPRGL